MSKKIKTKPVRRLAEQESERGKERTDKGWSVSRERDYALGANTQMRERVARDLRDSPPVLFLHATNSDFI